MALGINIQFPVITLKDNSEMDVMRTSQFMKRGRLTEALGNAMSFRKIDCESIEELLNACTTTHLPADSAEPLGVNPLEPNGKLKLSIPKASHTPGLVSPGVFYKNKDNSVRALQHFSFHGNLHNERSRPRRYTRANTTPVLDKAAKSCFLLRALSQKYGEDSAAASPMSEGNGGHRTMFMPTHTVVLLGELSVGKSALCRQFFCSEMNQDMKSSRKETCGRNESFAQQQNEFDAVFRTNESEEPEFSPRSDSHHIYERPVSVNGICERIRILDINAEKHRMECDSYADFEPYLETGDAYIITYAVTDRGTYKTASEILSRMSRFHFERLSALPIILVGNKCDLVRRRQVSTTEGIQLAAKYKLKFIETSASFNQNVTKLFEGVIQQIRLRNSCKDTVFRQNSSPVAPSESSSREFSGHEKLRSSLSSENARKHLARKMVSAHALSICDNEESNEVARSSSFDTFVTDEQQKTTSGRPEHMSQETLLMKGKFKRASTCLRKILNRRERMEKPRKCKSCQDLSVL